MILVDNAVELTAKTFFAVPKRVTGLTLTRRQRVDIQENFHTLLEGLENHASERLVGIHLEEVEWLHGLRNHLYHQGNGLTVESRFLQIYLKIAEQLFEALFECDLEISGRTDEDLLGEFFAEWIDIEKDLAKLNQKDHKPSARNSALGLLEEKKITEEEFDLLRDAIVIRNQVVHGEAEIEEVLRPSNMTKIKTVGKTIGRVLEQVGGLI